MALPTKWPAFAPTKMRALHPAGDEPECGNCRFGYALHSGLRDCRRHAPARSADHVMGQWPLVTDHNFCGDFDVRFVPVEA